MFRGSFIVFLLVFLAFQQAWAHEVWLQPKDGGLLVAYGHGEKLEAYDPQKVKEAKAVDCKGGAVPVESDTLKDGVLLKSKGTPAIVAVLFDGGYGVKTTEGWKKITKREAQGKFSIVEALKIRKYTKALPTPCDTFSKPLGLFFEIVPEKDPFSVKPGEKLPVKVLLEGKPVGGVVVRAGGGDHSKSQDPAKTDTDGKATVTITGSGLQLISASYKVPLKDDPDADILSVGATLTFAVR